MEDSKIRWLRGQRCASNGCVEVAKVGDKILIRDSKDPAGPVLEVARGDWQLFAASLTDGDFDSLK